MNTQDQYTSTLIVSKIDDLYKSEKSPLYFGIDSDHAFVANTYGHHKDRFLFETAIKEATIPTHISYQGKHYPITKIQSFAFQYCTNLAHISLPDTIESIEENAFYSCHSLSKIELPSALKTIANNAFEYCSSLKQIALPQTLEYIGLGAFSHTNLTIISHTPHYIIENDCLYNADKSQLLYVSKNHIGTFTIPSSVNIIGQSAFEDCSQITQIILPNTTTKIEASAFENCNTLTEIQLPEGITAIGQSAFFDCDALTHIVLPQSVTHIHTFAFGWCTSLQEIWIKNENCDYSQANIPPTTTIYLGANKKLGEHIETSLPPYPVIY